MKQVNFFKKLTSIILTVAVSIMSVPAITINAQEAQTPDSPSNSSESQVQNSQSNDNYSITKSFSNCSSTDLPSLVEDGTGVKFTIKPTSGYVLATLTITSGIFGQIPVYPTATADQYSFWMPSDDVTVTAVCVDASSATYYTVGLAQGYTDGDILTDAFAAQAGDTVTLTVEPYYNYVLATLTVTDSNGEVPVYPTGNTDEYSFTMPNDNVSVAATFASTGGNTYYNVELAQGYTDGDILTDAFAAQAGDTVTLTATADSSYVLTTLTVTEVLEGTPVPVYPNGNTGEYSFTMPNDNVSVAATFADNSDTSNPYYNVKLASSYTDGDILTDVVAAQASDTVTLTVKPKDGYQLKADSFKVYLDDSSEPIIPQPTGNPNKYSFTMPSTGVTSNVTVSATFEEITYSINVNPKITHGQVTPDKDTAKAGEEVRLTVESALGYQLQANSLTVTTDGSDPVDVDKTQNPDIYTFTMPSTGVTNYVTVSATFVGQIYDVEALNETTEGRGEITSCPEEVQYGGEPVKVELTANDGYEAKGVNYATSKDGQWENTEAKYNSDTNKWEFTVPGLAAGSTLYLQGIFEGIPHDVIIPSDTTVNGTVEVVPVHLDGNLSVADGHTYNTGSLYRVIAKPNEGYELKSLTVTGESGDVITLDENNIFTMPNENITVVAEFEPNSPSPTPTPTPTPDDGGGTGGGGTGTGGNSAGGANATGTSYSSGSAKTGDSTAVGVVGLATLAGLGVAVMLRRRRRK